jgi:O-antigen ligase
MVITIADPETRMFQVETESVKGSARSGYFTGRSNASVAQLLEPTRTIMALYLMAFVLNGIIRKSFGSFNRTELLMAFFIVILLASALLKGNVLGLNLKVVIDAFIVPFLAYFIARRLITDEDSYQKLIRCIVYMGFFMILICLPQRIIQGELFNQLSGPFSTKTAQYMILAPAFFIVLFHYFQGSVSRNRRQISPVQRFVLYLAPLTILLTWSRGAWVGFVVGFGAFMFLGWRLLKRSQAFGLLGTALVFTVVMGIGIHEVADELAEPLEQRGIFNTSTIYGRIANWRIAINEGLKAPIFGIGLNRLREVLATNEAVVAGVSNFGTARVHNSFLQILSEQGFLGLLVYMAIVSTIVARGIRLKRTSLNPRDKWRGIAVVAIMGAYLMPAMFASTIHVPVPLTHFFVYAYFGAIAGRYGPPYSVKHIKAAATERRKSDLSWAKNT